MANHQKDREAGPEIMKPRDWFVRPGAELVARRADVWALLAWYHHNHVEPHLGLMGVLRRFWWRISGQKFKLLSPWELIEARKAEIKLRRQVDAQLGRELETGAPSDAPIAAEPARPKIIT